MANLTSRRRRTAPARDLPGLFGAFHAQQRVEPLGVIPSQRRIVTVACRKARKQGASKKQLQRIRILARDFKASALELGSTYGLPDGYIALYVSPSKGPTLLFGIDRDGRASS